MVKTKLTHINLPTTIKGLPNALRTHIKPNGCWSLRLLEQPLSLLSLKFGPVNFVHGLNLQMAWLPGGRE